MFNAFLRNYFGFNKQQRNGLLVLIGISFVLLSMRLSMGYFIKPENIVVENLPLINQSLDSITPLKQYGTRAKNNGSNEIANFFVFDPNTVNIEQLLLLGFKERTAKTLIKFRSKGGKFKQKEDLLKVYGISKQQYKKIEPYILISQTVLPQNEKVRLNKTITEPEKIEIELLELNTADSIHLLGIKGIGPSFTNRILKYRNLLNGFYSVEQLREVYGFSAELFESVKHLFYVDSKLIKPIQLNSADFKSINRHPYITYELTKIICSARAKTPLTAQIFKTLVDDELLYARLLPYCGFD